MSKVKLLSISVVALVILNLLAITALIVGRPPMPHHAKMGFKHQTAKRAIKRLNFNEAQVKDYRVLIEQHQTAIKQTEETRNLVKKELLNLLSNTTIDEVKKDSLVQVLGNMQMEIETIHFQHFMDLKALCKPEQMNAFKVFSGEIIHIFDRKESHRHPKKQILN